MVINLEKARPAAGEGTRRQHTQMRGGKPTLVWVKKLGKKWVYDGMVNPKNKGDNVGKRSEVRRAHNDSGVADKADEDILIHTLGKLPSYDFIKQEQLRDVISRAGSPNLHSGLAKEISDATGIEVKTFKDVQDISLGILNNADGDAAKKLMYGVFSSPTHRRTFTGFNVDRSISTSYILAESLNSDSTRLAALADPRFDGEMFVDSFNIWGSTEAGMRTNFSTNVGRVPNVIIPWDRAPEFVQAWTGTDKKGFNKIMREIKSSNQYKQWQVTGDPELSGAVDELKKLTGLDVDTRQSHAVRRKTQLKKEYINQVIKVFESLKSGVDLSKYKPPDGHSMKIRISGMGTMGNGVKAAGFYTESDKTINISPSMPGTISHEIGHYLFNRHPAMQKEFMEWVKDSGLMTRIEQQTRGKMTPDERKLHVDHTMNAGMKEILTFLSPRQYYNSDFHLTEHQREGFKVLTNIFRQTMHTERLGSEWVNTPISHLSNLSDGALQSMAQAAISKGFYPNEDPVELGTRLKAVRDGVILLEDATKTMLSNYLSETLRRAVNGKAPADIRFPKMPSYWEQPTEIFARTFRTYVAMKDKQPVYNTAAEQNQAMTQTQIKKHAHGWGFPEIDPTMDMLKFDNNRLQKLLKKHIGGQVMKALIFNLLKSKHSEIATILAEEGKYKDGADVEFDPDQVAAGIKVEMEHTSSRAIAEEIVKDHLVEDPEYYTHLKEMEDKYIEKGAYTADDEDEEDAGSERDQAYAKEEAAERAKDRKRKAPPLLKSRTVFLLEKAKSFPDGTIRKHGGRTMVKKDGGWVPAEGGKPSAEKEDGKTSRNKKPTPKTPVTGSKELLSALKKIGSDKAPLLDDLNGADRKLYNAMTKAGLVKWTHLAEEEYKAELTPAGQKALASGHALERKSIRDKKKKKK